MKLRWQQIFTAKAAAYKMPDTYIFVKLKIRKPDPQKFHDNMYPASIVSCRFCCENLLPAQLYLPYFLLASLRPN
jgi:hypothetical protein